MKKLFYILPFLLASSSVFASDRSTLSVGVDNDGVFGVDRDYTSGVFIDYTSGGMTPSLGLKPLSLAVWGVSSMDKIGITLGQKIYTPTDISSSQPQINDRPYAGYLYLETNYISLSPNVAQRINLTFGTTGERSRAKESQELIHSIIGSDEPQGWQYQVDNQFAGGIGYLVHLNILRDKFWSNSSLELSNITEGNGGNFRSNVATGFMLRWGYNLADSFGAAEISMENPFRPGMLGASGSGWFAYTGIKTGYVFNDITIEGDRSGLPQPSSQYDVTLEHVQSTAILGLAAYNEHFGVNLSLSGSTKSYNESEYSTSGMGGISVYAFF
ncbi:lipid A deacylase LpxR family protein [Vibrio sp. S4M6]|uniref:lipid A deacylase LpxR family protein n=1 Tax=Vibrio sinus TaxID=2946865 RepID=UPI00202A4B71|nr:lipid A deacylase LpxR family protein [Vibrio sinus]MCL9782318.1 lipid A deacylase LpxR family protein [Vibrio sinus]